jgi:uncharacterized membrane protein YphA (DoxX/SURF4 family)
MIFAPERRQANGMPWVRACRVVREHLAKNIWGSTDEKPGALALARVIRQPDYGAWVPQTLRRPDQEGDPDHRALPQHGGLENFAKAVERIGAPAPPALAALSAGTEFFGGLALVLGWHTRLATLLLMGNMSTAIGKVHWSKGLLNPDGFEKALLFLCGFATIFIAGPGKLSLDHN